MARWRFTCIQTLRARFLLALALIGILPMGLIGLGMATLDRRALAEQSAQELTGLARGLAGQLEVYLDDLLSTTRAVAALPEIVSMDPARQEPLLKELFQHYPPLERLSTFDLVGAPLASSHPNGAPAVAAWQSFQTAAQRGYQAWEVAVALRSRRPSLLIHTDDLPATRDVSGLDFRQTTSLGLQLVCLLTEQLGGTITLEHHHGTTFTITFAPVTRSVRN